MANDHPNKVYNSIVLLISLAMVGAEVNQFVFPFCKPAVTHFLEAIGDELQLTEEVKQICGLLDKFHFKSLPWLCPALTQYKDAGSPTKFSRRYTSNYRLIFNLPSDGESSVKGSATTSDWNDQLKNNSGSWLTHTEKGKDNNEITLPLVPWHAIRSSSLKDSFKQALGHLHDAINNSRAELNIDLQEVRDTADEAQATHEASMRGIAEWDELQSWVKDINYSDEAYETLKDLVANVERARCGDGDVIHVTSGAIRLSQKISYATPLVRGIDLSPGTTDASDRAHATRQNGRNLKNKLTSAKRTANTAQKDLSDMQSSDEYTELEEAEKEQRKRAAVLAAKARIKLRLESGNSSATEVVDPECETEHDITVGAGAVDKDNDTEEVDRQQQQTSRKRKRAAADVAIAVEDDSNIENEGSELRKLVKSLELACEQANTEVSNAERKNTLWEKAQASQSPRYYYQHTGTLCTYMEKLVTSLGMLSGCCNKPLTFMSSEKVEQGFVVRQAFACSECFRWQHIVGCEELVSSPYLPKREDAIGGHGEADVNLRHSVATFMSGLHKAGSKKFHGEMGVMSSSDATASTGWNKISDVMPGLVEECCREARVKMVTTDPNRDRHTIKVRLAGSGPDGEVGELHASAIASDGGGAKRACNHHITGRVGFSALVAGLEGTDTKPMVIALQTYCNRCVRCEVALRQLKAEGKDISPEALAGKPLHADECFRNTALHMSSTESQGIPLAFEALMSKEKVFAGKTEEGEPIDVAMTPRMFASDGDTRVHENVQLAVVKFLEQYELVDPSQADLLVGERFGDPNHTIKWVGGQMREHMTGSALKLSKRMQSLLTFNVRILKRTLIEIEARVGAAALRTHPDTLKAVQTCVQHCQIAVLHFVGNHQQCDPQVCEAMRVFQSLVEAAESIGDSESGESDELDAQERIAVDDLRDQVEAAFHDELWIESSRIVAENKGAGGVVSVHAASSDNVDVNKLLQLVKKNFTTETVYLLARSISSQLVECLWSILIQFTSGKRLCYDAKNRVGDFVGFSAMSLNLGWPETIRRVLESINLPDTDVAKFTRNARHKLKLQSAARHQTELYKRKRSATQQLAAELAAAVRMSADTYGNAVNGATKKTNKKEKSKQAKKVADAEVKALEKSFKASKKATAAAKRVNGQQALLDSATAVAEAETLVMSMMSSADIPRD